MGKGLGYVRLTVPGRPELGDLTAVIKIGGVLLEDVIEKINADTKKQEDGRKKLDDETVKRIVVENMEQIKGDDLDALKAGDVVIKHDVTGDHAYHVSYRGDNGICITYVDCENVETVAYDKVEGEWVFNSKDVTHIAASDAEQ